MTHAETLTQPTWTLGERLSKARDHAGLTRSQMADYLGVSERTIRNYENETVHVTRLIALAYAAETGVHVDWLTGDVARSSCIIDVDIGQLELFANTNTLVDSLRTLLASVQIEPVAA